MLIIGLMAVLLACGPNPMMDAIEQPASCSRSSVPEQRSGSMAA
jgi:hypothetical protein